MKNHRTKILWDKVFKQIKTEKELRLAVSRYLKTHLKGLSPGFYLGVEVVTLRPAQVIITIPAHSEGNLIRVAQMDCLAASLEQMGVAVEIFYLDDLLEREDHLQASPN